MNSDCERQYEDEIAALQDDINDVHSANSNDFASLRQQRQLDSQKLKPWNGYRKEQLDSVIESKGKELDDIKEEITKERQIMIERLEDAKLKNQTIADEFIQKKNDYKREIALTTQHIEFQAKKITDLERALRR